jgi:hypothetical protein
LYATIGTVNNWDGMVVMAMASTIGTETIGWNGGFGWNNWYGTIVGMAVLME